jgi:hypothetical protein
MYPIATSGSLTSAGSYNFASIPQTFDHLQLRIFGRSTFDRGSGNVDPVNNYLRINGDSGNNYAYHSIVGTGATASAGGATAASAMVLGGSNPALRTLSGVYSNIIIDILDYRNTNKNKTVKAIGGYDANGTGIVYLLSSFLNSTAAVTSLNIFNDADYAIGSRFDLYGISTSSATGA